MTVTNNQAGAPNYFPNSFSGPRADRKYQEHRTNLSADVARWNSADEDNFTQVGGPDLSDLSQVNVAFHFPVLDLAYAFQLITETRLEIIEMLYSFIHLFGFSRRFSSRSLPFAKY